MMRQERRKQTAVTLPGPYQLFVNFRRYNLPLALLSWQLCSEPGFRHSEGTCRQELPRASSSRGQRGAGLPADHTCPPPSHKPPSERLLTALCRAASPLQQRIFPSFAIVMQPKELGWGLGEVAVSPPIIQLGTGKEPRTPPSDLICGRRSGQGLLN